MNIENFKAPVGGAVVASIVAILLDYYVIGAGVFSLLTFIPVIATALLILALVVAGIYNGLKKDKKVVTTPTTPEMETTVY